MFAHVDISLNEFVIKIFYTLVLLLAIGVELVSTLTVRLHVRKIDAKSMKTIQIIKDSQNLRISAARPWRGMLGKMFV